MTVREIADKLELEILTDGAGLDREVTGGYASDLLSDVIGHGEAGNIWVTLQTHGNIVAVATLKELAAVVLVGGRMPEAETLDRARQEKVLLLRSSLPSFEVAGRLYQLGVRGKG